MQLHPPSLRLRPATTDDLPAMLDIYARAVRETVVSFEYAPPSIDKFAQRHADVTRRFPWLACFMHEQLVGYIYATTPFSRPAYQWTTDFSVYIHESFRRTGVGRTLLSSLCTLLAAQGFFKIYGTIVATNTPSLKLVTALGFTEEARFRDVGYKFDQWHDVIWMGKALAPEPPQGTPPVNFSALSPSVVEQALHTGIPPMRPAS